jgi:tetratricopeptide (TPR) repeat protein
MHNEFLKQGLSAHKAGNLNEAASIYSALMNQKPFDTTLQFLLADVFLRQERNGLAINLLTNLLQSNPKNADAWCNLGVGFRKENFYEEAKQAYFKAIEHGGETVEACSNMAGLYADRAEPEKALEWCNKALKLDANSVQAMWQKALALLTTKNWKDGWKLYESRQRLESWDSRKTIDAPIWDGSPVEHLYIHGEQGVGDEVMFASMLPYARPLAKRITIEVHEKFASLIRSTWPEFTVVTSETRGDYDAKIAIGSLNTLFDKFNEGAYLAPDANRVSFYRKELEKLGPGPYVAVTWLGGTKMTRVEDRSVSLKLMQPILDAYTCVSGQYNSNPMIEQERLDAGLAKINDESVGGDLGEQAALFAACDAVVTVQQTAVHVAGSVGAKTYALIGSHPHWRYGVEGETLPWYESVRLFRQKKDWAEVVDNVKRALDADFGKLQGTEQRAA